MNVKIKSVKWIVLLNLLFVMAGCTSNKALIKTGDKKEDQNWTGTWATAQMLVEPKNMPPEPGLAQNTLRQIIKVSLGGKQIRLRFSNLFSDQPAVLKSVSVANVTEAPAVDIKTQKILSFKGSPQVTLGADEVVYSDAFDFELQPGQLLAITIHYGEISSNVSGHPGSRTTSYILQGDHINNESFAGAVKTDHWYSIMGVDISSVKNESNVVCLGNSIIDGRGSGTNKQNRWTDILASRLNANKNTAHIGVLNLGIGGNCVVRGGLGPTALNRFDRDVLSQSGTKWLIILEGINDIGGIRKAEDASVTAKEIIEGYKVMIDKAHAKGIKVFGGTILPFEKSFYDAPFKQDARDIVNEWIRTKGNFDAVIDFDKAMASDVGSKTILPDMHDNDFLHPNEKGYQRMGETVDLDLFQ
ncbi:SGNH/GDSL hydrolase family protein [Flavobacterium johnsoniae]|uniref:Lipolytic enzyme, G-D-S-L family n=1 Tax=Flavobacterium johnsoniae (strain ATCC 17061 / DSM 2064 / JCM 8514 / BCRC 14874 / CCUG 350202 / NBRC 14942 / NCIMB 11054 / UW101) TaxID=376686 RepID=A5FD35_FLAJ1|nr:SGNH/GDSL hydrolase family protein [Flavobacterium johnsoniae]ABQ06890.1 lipolytic enzyme, G-D-S-L family [Flavobacterium johnsoniae UW101]OXE97252.1 GDSL family lipase [Flavobacterium johnsoniae UW101]WQG81276.1 SGNH/GDSL hydrolase family protein [Flavobacterium johnsoniae UW101]SHL37543.1 Lysophospholipase L1 [Flavobacterium johnsoniae]